MGYVPGEQRFIETVKELNTIGYGNMMGIVSRHWREKDPGGALTVGPCYKQVEVYGGYFEIVDKVEALQKVLNEQLKFAQSLHQSTDCPITKEQCRLAIISLSQISKGGQDDGDRTMDRRK